MATAAAEKSFAALKSDALSAISAVELFRIAAASNQKLLRNVQKAQLLSYTHGSAADADHYFQNVIPGWTKTNNEIQAILAAEMVGRTDDDIVAIITEATGV